MSVKDMNVCKIFIPINEDDAADFEEKDMAERETANSASVVSSLHHSFVPRVFLRRNVSHSAGLAESKAFSTKSVIPEKCRRYTGQGPTSKNFFDIVLEESKSSFKQLVETSEKDSTKETSQLVEQPPEEEVFVTAMNEAEDDMPDE